MALGGVAIWVSAAGAVVGSSLMIAGAIVIALAATALKIRAVISPQAIVAHNLFSTRNADTSTLAGVDISWRAHASGSGWVARVALADGTSFWVEALELAGSSKAPDAGAVEEVDDVRRILGVGGETLAPN